MKYVDNLMKKALGLVGLVAIILGGCSQDKLGLSPMSRPLAPAKGHAFHSMLNGKAVTATVTEVTDSGITYSRTDGCIWTVPNHENEMFLVATSWQGCLGSGGERKYTSIGKSLWPLAVGKKTKWLAKGKLKGKKDWWESDGSCEVEGTERLEVADKEYNTFRVTCSTTWTSFIYYVSPEAGAIVRFKQRSAHKASTAATIDLDGVSVDRN